MMHHMVKCHYCDKEFAKFPCLIKKSKRHFCSLTCYFQYQHEPKPLADTLEMFWAKVIHMPEGCWDWIGAMDGEGYPCSNENGQSIRAYIWIYKTILGPIPEGYEVDHLCHNRACVNPAHLEAVPPLVNHQRAIMGYKANWKAKQTHCHKGHLYDEANTRWIFDKKGNTAPTRVCRACVREYMRSYNIQRRQRLRENKLAEFPKHVVDAANRSEKSIANQFSGGDWDS